MLLDELKEAAAVLSRTPRAAEATLCCGVPSATRQPRQQWLSPARLIVPVAPALPHAILLRGRRRNVQGLSCQMVPDAAAAARFAK